MKQLRPSGDRSLRFGGKRPIRPNSASAGVVSAGTTNGHDSFHSVEFARPDHQLPVDLASLRPSTNAGAGVGSRAWWRSAGLGRVGQHVGPLSFAHAAPDAVGLVNLQRVLPARRDDGAGRTDCFGPRLAPGSRRAPFALGVKEESAGQTAAETGSLPIPEISVGTRESTRVSHVRYRLCHPQERCRPRFGRKATVVFTGDRSASSCRVLVDHDCLVIKTIGRSITTDKTLISRRRAPTVFDCHLPMVTSEWVKGRVAVVSSIRGRSATDSRSDREHWGISPNLPPNGVAFTAIPSRLCIAESMPVYGAQLSRYYPSALLRRACATGSIAGPTSSTGGLEREVLTLNGSSTARVLVREVSEVSL